MAMMAVRLRLSRSLYAIADRAADHHARRAGQCAYGGSDGGASGAALMLGPVVSERTCRGDQQRRAEQCRHEFVGLDRHKLDLLAVIPAREIPVLGWPKLLILKCLMQWRPSETPRPAARRGACSSGRTHPDGAAARAHRRGREWPAYSELL